MLYIIAFIFLFLGLNLKYSKYVTAMFYFFLWVLFGWSYGNADYNIHLRRFNLYESLSWQTEPLYNVIMRIFNLANLSYQSFLIVISAFILFSYSRFIKRNTRYVNFVLALYMIFPFCMDVTIVRYTIAMSVVILGFNFLLLHNKSGTVKYIVFVLIASMVHFSAFFALIFILPEFFNRMKLITVVIVSYLSIGLLGGTITALSEKIAGISFMNIGSKVNIVLNASRMRYNLGISINYGLKIIIIFLLFTMIYNTINMWAKKNKSECIKSNVELLEFIMNINIASLLIIPFLIISADVFRIQMSLSIVNFVGIAQYFEMKRKLIVGSCNRKKLSLTTLFVILFTAMYVFIGLYLWVLSSRNIHTVFRALFENNLLF